MNERVKFVASYLEAELAFSELCEQFEISRKTGYKWIARYQEGGVSALVDRSRAPLSHPHAVSEDVVKALLNIRARYPRWGPRKLLVILERQRPEQHLPVPSTVGDILRKHGLVGRRKRIRRSSPYNERLRTYDAPNSIWCADFKGHFPVSGQRCHPLTISDGFSRYLLRCHSLRTTRTKSVQKVFESAFHEFGLPDAIRTDNGPPFSSLAPGGLSRLAVWWIRLGIRPERIMPGRPDQNGRHERMHSTLKVETAAPPRNSFSAQQRAFDDFRYEYNHIRPHEALGQQVPAVFYRRSSREFPTRLPEVEYPPHFRVERAYPNGVISLMGTQWYISGTLANENIGLEELDDGHWKVYFGHVPLGMLDVRNAKERGCRQFGLLVPWERLETPRQRRRRLRRS